MIKVFTGVIATVCMGLGGAALAADSTAKTAIGGGAGGAAGAMVGQSMGGQSGGIVGGALGGALGGAATTTGQGRTGAMVGGAVGGGVGAAVGQSVGGQTGSVVGAGVGGAAGAAIGRDMSGGARSGPATTRVQAPAAGVTVNTTRVRIEVDDRPPAKVKRHPGKGWAKGHYK
ncbi:MAG: hypothetical protein A3G27_16880 [Betaproteobacteria bacterium RIFCSPLOWO2_12_FULL_66_14]|nr:MAG: hypothetical protein A3G27_16880 [Betaproteobacteria bacterium RIFCSPLOWO2_12_FULL_66_14]